jgi:hypothetical protein
MVNWLLGTLPRWQSDYSLERGVGSLSTRLVPSKVQVGLVGGTPEHACFYIFRVVLEGYTEPFHISICNPQSTRLQYGSRSLLDGTAVNATEHNRSGILRVMRIAGICEHIACDGQLRRCLQAGLGGIPVRQVVFRDNVCAIADQA